MGPQQIGNLRKNILYGSLLWTARGTDGCSSETALVGYKNNNSSYSYTSVELSGFKVLSHTSPWGPQPCIMEAEQKLGVYITHEVTGLPVKTE